MKELKEGEELFNLRGSEGIEFCFRIVRGRRGTEMAEIESGAAMNLPEHCAGGRRVCIA